MRTAAVITLGCKLNLADSEQIAIGLSAHGYRVVDTLCEADAIVINTCSVTHVADQKSRKLIRAARRLSPHATIGVTGCFPQSAGEAAAQTLGANIVAGTTTAEKQRLIAHLIGESTVLSPRCSVPAPPPEGRILHTRRFVKAQEGCNDVCAFCIVPRTRGREASRSIDEVVIEVCEAERAGTREVVITGTQLGAWGRDLEAPARPHHLIAALLGRTAIPRIRFSSLQPQDITPELLGLWSDPRLMPHFHLALQSGSEAVLRRMRRRYSAQEFRQAAERIRAAVPDVGITTDVIAGFPGETRDEFEETVDFCRELRFARIHAFPYSVRSHTAAARMGDQVGPEEKRRRMADLLAVGAESAQSFARQQHGRRTAVLWENTRVIDGIGYWHGHAGSYLDVYTAGDALRGRVTAVVIGDRLADGVAGEVLSPQSSVLSEARSGPCTLNGPRFDRRETGSEHRALSPESLAHGARS